MCCIIGTFTPSHFVILLAGVNRSAGLGWGLGAAFSSPSSVLIALRGGNPPSYRHHHPRFLLCPPEIMRLLPIYPSDKRAQAPYCSYPYSSTESIALSDLNRAG
ncbi:hypothetical protein EDB89DRAFT_638617 [Lactarius sanguifluus]|nr:hypothetical protein EDB89DRAFT_638617 [Lactarius sanguifluus]